MKNFLKKAAQIFIASATLNLVWEVAHSPLYETALAMPIQQYSPMILTMSTKDGLWITLFYGISALLFKNINILKNRGQLTAFITMALLFSFLDEKISLTLGRWEYTASMPTLLGVGVTPLLELAVTGVLTFLCLFDKKQYPTRS